MRNFCLFCFSLAMVLMFGSVAHTQSTMNIYLNDGSVMQIPLNQIDSVTHSTDGDPLFEPLVETSGIDCVLKDRFEAMGEVLNDGGLEVTLRGICWSTSPEPTVDDNVLESGSGLGAFMVEITDLQMETTYFVRAFAENGMGVGYGEVLEVATPGVIDDFLNASLDYGEVSDIDGNTYATIIVGDQEWMAENLRTTTYSNGDEIPIVTDDDTWEWLDDGACVWYMNDCNSEIPYGRLYNWHAVEDDRNICPAGWHVPGNDEWDELTDLFGGMAAGGALKSAGTLYWFDPNMGGSNESGMSLLPGGFREDDGFFNALGVMACYWTSTDYGPNDAFYRELSYGHSNIFTTFENRRSGFSVRCVKD